MIAAAHRPARPSRDEVDDQRLLENFRQNAAGSREAVYHAYRRRVFALVSRIAGPADAEEVSQEAFIRIFRGLPRFRGDSALSTWVYRLAVNAAISHRARRDRHARVQLEAVDEDVAFTLTHAPQDGDAVLRTRLERGLARLPVGYRTVVVLHDVEGLEHEEIADILQCHVGTSKSQLHKARARLREILATEGITASDVGPRRGRDGGGEGGSRSIHGVREPARNRDLKDGDPEAGR